MLEKINKYKTNNFGRNIFFPLLFLYLVSYFLKLGFAETVFGLPLLFFYPGSFLVALFKPLELEMGKIGTFSLKILYSFFISSVVGYLSQSHFGFNSTAQIWAIILLNIVFCFATIIVPKFKFWIKFNSNKKKSIKKYSISKFDLLPFFILGSIILLTIVISPLAQNADNYLLILKKSISSNLLQANARQLVTNSRQLFISFLALSSKFLNLDLLFTYRNIFLALFFTSTLIFYDYLKRNFSSNYLVTLLYLALLIPPVIITEINIIRPQVAMLVLTIPVLILSIESVKSQKILPATIALIFAGIGLKFHELNIVLLFIATIAFIANLIHLTFNEKIITWKHYVLLLIVVYPYIILFNLLSVLSQVFYMADYAAGFLNQFGWKWWFLSNYTSIDGANLSWTGINALFYYLYNGFFLILLLLGLYILIKIKHLKTGFYLLLPTIYFLIFFAIAEVLPRIGLNFLPNRAWVHLMLAAVVLLALYLEILCKNKINIRYLNFILLCLIIIGSLGILYVSKNNVDQIFKEEMPVAEYIKHELPADCVIISSQDNLALVNIYADRNYGRITPNHQINKSEFDNLIETELKDLSNDKIIVIKPKKIEIIETLENDRVIKKEERIIQNQLNNITKASYTGQNSVYFLYSYRKLSGLNNQREYKKEIIDATNKDLYQNLGYEVMFSDQNALLIKIK